MAKPNTLTTYTVVLFRHEQRYLLLRRADSKRFAPGRWTGVGGLVESDEYGDLEAAALREVVEETGIVAAEITDFVLRRVLLLARPGSSLTLLLYFTGSLSTPLLPPCPEGTLAWVRPEQLPDLDVIESTRPVLHLLIADQERDPQGNEALYLGIADYQPDGTLARVVWA